MLKKKGGGGGRESSGSVYSKNATSSNQPHYHSASILLLPGDSLYTFVSNHPVCIYVYTRKKEQENYFIVWKVCVLFCLLFF